MLKWDCVKSGSGNTAIGYKVMQGKRLIFNGTYRQCSQAAAKHNAVIDMAFDSPGNVS